MTTTGPKDGCIFCGQRHGIAARRRGRKLRPELAAAAGRNPEAVAVAGDRLAGFQRDVPGCLIASDGIGPIDVSTPGDTHSEIAIAALEAAKHVLCEPLSTRSRKPSG
ncbi:Gfo/Idh/MocA family oxidoreductase [Arthrobacter sp. 92]|uniref:Gfo/Idh/MocA family oxidoreductase n=1 Tax=Arthrobacter sp. 92 TaxID=3418175 RepID=UPI003D052829